MARLTPEVAAHLRHAANELLWASEAWEDRDQRAFDTSRTLIAKALGMSIDEMAFEIVAFIDEEPILPSGRLEEDT